MSKYNCSVFVVNCCNALSIFPITLASAIYFFFASILIDSPVVHNSLLQLFIRGTRMGQTNPFCSEFQIKWSRSIWITFQREILLQGIRSGKEDPVSRSINENAYHACSDANRNHQIIAYARLLPTTHSFNFIFWCTQTQRKGNSRRSMPSYVLMYLCVADSFILDVPTNHIRVSRDARLIIGSN